MRLNLSERPYQNLIPMIAWCFSRIYHICGQMKKTNEIGHTSKAIFLSLHISMSLGCLIIESLHELYQIPEL